MNKFSSSIIMGTSLLGLLHGCKPDTPQTVSPINAVTPNTTPTTEGSSSLRFTEVSEAAGIHYKWTVQGERPLTILQTIGNGCAFLDYDNDRSLDILLVGIKPALYRGDGKGKFTDVTQAVGLNKLSGHFLGCAVGDYNNDGFADVYLSAYRGGILLHNQGGKLFGNVTAQAGLKAQPWGTSCAFGDVDGDGKLDLYVCNYVQFSAATQPQLCEFAGIPSSCGPRFYHPETGVLYRNMGNGKFADVTKTTGASTISGKGLGVAIADFDGSGRQSIAIANDEMPGDLLYPKNPSGKTALKFDNIAPSANTSHDSDGNVHGGMGTDWGDYDNDGKLDLVVATFQHEPKNIYHNDGGLSFTDNSARLGLGGKTAADVAFGVKWLDADNDGFLDLIFANGHVQDNIDAIDKSMTYKQKVQIFHNIGGTSLEDAGVSAGASFQTPIVGRGLAVGDYDNDGKVDVLIVDSEGKPLLLHNETPNAGNWLSLKLVGSRSNRDGIGALVTIEADGKTLLRHCATDGSYLSASDGRVHVGIGKATAANITVKWTSGKTTTLKNAAANTPATIKE